MENSKFPFTSWGVQDWKTKLYASSDATIYQEQHLIMLDLSQWLPLRFELDATQIEYMHSLGTTSLDQIAKDINEAIDNRADITLRRDEPTAAAQNTPSTQQTPPQNSKVADSAKKYIPVSTLHAATLDNNKGSLVSLDFHFYHTNNSAQP